MTVRLAWVAIAVLATYLTFIGGGWLGIYAAPLRVLTMLAAGATLLAWFFAARRDEQWRPRSVLTPAIAASLASLAISTAFSRVPRVSLEYLGYAIVLAALYLLLVRISAHPYFTRRIATLATILFGVIAAAFLGAVVLHWIDWWGLLGRLAIPPLRPNFEGLTYLNPSAVLTMVALFAVPAAATFGSTAGRGLAVLLAILGVIAVVAFLSGSRAGWLALALTVVVGLAAVLLDRDGRAAIRAVVTRSMSSPRARAATASLAIAAVILVVAFAPAILRRLSEGGEEARAQYAVTAIRMFASSPIVGTGPGTWVIQRIGATETGEIDYYIPHAHNLEVQTLAELGLVGALAGVVLVVSLGRLVLEAMRDPDPLRRRFGWATFLGLAYFGLHQLLDFYANVPAALFAAALPVAYLDATARPRAVGPSQSMADRLARSPRRTIARWLAVGVVGLAVAGLILQEVPALQAARAVELADRGEWAAADPPARAAAEADPEISSYEMTAGLTASRAGDHARAAGHFDRVARRDDLPEAWVDLAAEQLELGDEPDARASIQAAFRLGRQRAAVAMAIADLAIRLDLDELATEATVDAISASPTLVADPWWTGEEVRTATLARALAEAKEAGSDTLRWQLELMSGDVDAARSIAAGTPDGAFNLLVVDGWRDQEPALERLSAACYASPLDPTRLTWCARVAAHVGDTNWATTMRRLLEVLGPGASNAAGRLRIDAPGDPTTRADGGLEIFWGTFTYRRFTPRDLLVPSVLHLSLE